VLRGQRLDRHIGERDKLVFRDCSLGKTAQNNAGARINWMFSTEKARQKLARAYPDPAKES